jgi:transcriptional regulator with XRE-family HTH domain
MCALNAVTETLPRSHEDFPHALSGLLAERRVDTSWLSHCTAFSERYLADVLDGVAEPSDVLVVVAAQALDVTPSFFLDYRLRCVVDSIERDVLQLNALFLESLSAIERAVVADEQITDHPLPTAVAALLPEQELTHRDLAETIGMAPGRVSQLLRQEPPPSDFVESLALALGVDPHYFREYRVTIVAEWFRRQPTVLDSLFDEAGDPLALAPYAIWRRRIDSFDRLEPKELLRTLLEIVAVEGPVLGWRIHDLLFAASGSPATKQRRRHIDRALTVLVATGRVIADDEVGTGIPIGFVLRPPDVARVVPRRRGSRLLTEVPLRELASVAKAAVTVQRLSAVDQLQDALAKLYDVRYPSGAERERMNRAINLTTRT